MPVKTLFSALLLIVLFHTPIFSQNVPPEIVIKAADTTASFGEDSGTLVEGFEYIEAIDKAGDQSEYWFRCIANLPGGNNTRGILPQQGGIALKVPYQTNATPDTTLSLTSLLTFERPMDFSDPYGNSIGAYPDTIVDTSYFRCNQWEGTLCLGWSEVTDTALGYDSVFFDSSTIGLLDSNIVVVIDGSITLKNHTPFDIMNCDINGDNEIDISDLVCVVVAMFSPEDSNSCPVAFCDIDADGNMDISDLVYLINYMFSQSPD